MTAPTKLLSDEQLDVMLSCVANGLLPQLEWVELACHQAKRANAAPALAQEHDPLPALHYLESSTRGRGQWENREVNVFVGKIIEQLSASRPASAETKWQNGEMLDAAIKSLEAAYGSGETIPGSVLEFANYFKDWGPPNLQTAARFILSLASRPAPTQEISFDRSDRFFAVNDLNVILEALRTSQHKHKDLAVLGAKRLIETLTASRAGRAETKWCSYCRKSNHNDAECWSTRPADWGKPKRIVMPDGREALPAATGATLVRCPVADTHGRCSTADECAIEGRCLHPAPPAAEASEGATRPCTCHPDDDPPRPCPQKFAYSECMRAALASALSRERASVYNAARWSYIRNHVSVILTDDSLHIVGLRVEAFYEEPREIPLIPFDTGPLFEAAIDAARSKEGAR